MTTLSTLSSKSCCRNIDWEKQVCNWFAHASEKRKLSLAKYKEAEGGETLIFSAAGLNSIAVAELLCKAHAEIDLPSPIEGGATPLMEAVCGRCHEMVKWLLDKGADKKKIMPGTDGQTLQNWVIKHFPSSDDRLKDLLK